MNSILSPIKALPLPVCVLDRSFHAFEFNEEWRKVFAPLLTENSIFNYFNSKDQKRLKLAFKDSKANGSSQVELDIGDETNRNSYLWSISHDSRLDIYVLLAQSQNQVRNLQVKFERMFHATTDAIMLLDEVGFTDCNQATLNIFKMNSVKDFVKKHPGELSPEFQPDGESSQTKADRMINIALERGHNFFEWMHKNSHGEDFLCEVLLNPIVLNDKKYLQASVRDISDRVRLQKEVDDTKAIQVNASRMASLGEMAGGIAHEINNPLSIIRAQSERIESLLQRGEEIDQEYLKKSISRIITTCDRIGSIVRGLKQLSRDSSSDDMTSTDVRQIIDQVKDLSFERLRHNMIDFQIEGVDGAIHVDCRPVEISQVLLNLLNNSVDSIQGQPNAWIKITLTKEDEYLRVKVSDSGNGIPKAVAAKLGQPFFTTKEVGKGTGLGLSISKRIIEKHLGKFYYDAEAKNTTFVFTLPLHD